MKTTRLATAVLLTLLSTILVSAQASDDKSGPKDVVVLEKSWHKDVRYPDRDLDPFRASEDHIRQTREEKAYIRDLDYRLPQTTEPRRPTPQPRPLPATKPIETYAYKLTVKNTGTKRINAIEWEYQFLHPETHELMGSRRITSNVNLSPGKTQVIVAKLLQKPTNIIEVDQLDKKGRDQFEERLIIHRIYYRDHTLWQRIP